MAHVVQNYIVQERSKKSQSRKLFAGPAGSNLKELLQTEERSGCSTQALEEKLEQEA